MDILWAPWRIDYVTAEKPDGCVFCMKAAEQRDRENFILYRGASCFVILNIYPYNNGHLMVVPFQHSSSIEDLEDATAQEFMALTQRSVNVIRTRMRPTGFNIGINQGVPAGAGVADHIHLHVVPRWIGDTNFMPVLGDTRVMPESLEQSFALLADGFKPE